MKSVIWKAFAEILRVIATAIVALIGINATGCIAVPIF